MKVENVPWTLKLIVFRGRGNRSLRNVKEPEVNEEIIWERKTSTLPCVVGIFHECVLALAACTCGISLFFSYLNGKAEILGLFFPWHFVLPLQWKKSLRDCIYGLIKTKPWHSSPSFCKEKDSTTLHHTETMHIHLKVFTSYYFQLNAPAQSWASWDRYK